MIFPIYKFPAQCLGQGKRQGDVGVFEKWFVFLVAFLERQRLSIERIPFCLCPPFSKVPRPSCLA
ncbi:MAG: hypothetical protein A2734_00105 [Parcubacteria group bacterium RIFCSPHIGHO2_01_FULL_40_30]|nr:MAG: hypothetical protein A2734_00105 [Parcubacteria group bacterium RIFCSPHIGHO2_01_FULL_40_30]